MKFLFYFLAALCFAVIWKGFPDLGFIWQIVLSVVSLAVLRLIFAKAFEEPKSE